MSCFLTGVMVGSGGTPTVRDPFSRLGDFRPARTTWSATMVDTPETVVGLVWSEFTATP